MKPGRLAIVVILCVLSAAVGVPVALAGTGGGNGSGTGSGQCSPVGWQVVSSTNSIGTSSRNYPGCTADGNQSFINSLLSSDGAQTCINDTNDGGANNPIIWYLGFGGSSSYPNAGPPGIQSNLPLVQYFRGYQVGAAYIDSMIEQTPDIIFTRLGYSAFQETRLKQWATGWVNAHDGNPNSPVIVVCTDAGDIPAPSVCPNHTSSGVDQYIDNPGAVITPGTSPSAAGAYCYSNSGDSVGSTTHDSYKYTYVDSSTTQTREVPAGTPTTQQYGPLPVSWTTSMQADLSTGGQTALTHPGPTQFSPVSSSEESAWGNFLGGIYNGEGCGSVDPGIGGAASTTGSEGEATVSLGPTDEASEAQGGIFDVTESYNQGLFDTYTTYQQEQVYTTDYVSTYVTETKTTTTYLYVTSYNFMLPASQWTPTGQGSYTTSTQTYNLGSSSTTTGPTFVVKVQTNNPTWVNQGGLTVASCNVTNLTPVDGPSIVAHHFQILTNHADPSGFSTAEGYVGSGNSSAIGQVDGSYSDALVTRDYGAAPMPLGYAPLNGNPGERQGLFDKLAAYPGGTQTVASQDMFDYFRDGDPHPLLLPFWNPAVGGAITSPGSVQATALSVWDQSSPLPVEGSEGSNCLNSTQGEGYEDCGYVTVESPGGTNLFDDTSSGVVAPPTAWNSSYGDRYEYTATVADPRTAYTISSIWPSNTSEPVVVDGYEIYNAGLAINEPTTDIGFGNPGGGESYAAGAVSIPYNGIVFATHASTDPALESLVSSSTGTQEFSNSGTPTDTLDCAGNSPEVASCAFPVSISSSQGYPALTSAPATESPYFTAISFLRGTGE